MTPSQLEQTARAMDQLMNDMSYHIRNIRGACLREREHPNPDPAQRMLIALGGDIVETIRYSLGRKYNNVILGEERDAERIPSSHYKDMRFETMMEKCISIYDEAEAKLTKKKYCKLCNKHVKNMKSHEKAQSHVGRVRIQELRAEGYVEVRNNNSCGKVVTQLLDPSDMQDQDNPTRQAKEQLRDKYKPLMVEHPHGYNRAGGSSRWNTKMWVLEYVNEYSDALAKGIDWSTYGYYRNDEAKSEHKLKKAAWRTKVDGVIFDPAKLKTFAAFTALRG